MRAGMDQINGKWKAIHAPVSSIKSGFAAVQGSPIAEMPSVAHTLPYAQGMVFALLYCPQSDRRFWVVSTQPKKRSTPGVGWHLFPDIMRHGIYRHDTCSHHRQTRPEQPTLMMSEEPWKPL